MLHPRGRDGEKGPPVSNRQASSRARFAGRGLWDGGAGIAVVGEPESMPTLSEYKHLLTGT